MKREFSNLLKKKRLAFLLAFAAISVLGGCNYRLFDLTEYPDLKGSLGNINFKTVPTEASFESIYKTVIIQSKCLNCHKPGEDAEDVPLDTYKDLIRADAGDPLVVPGKPEESLFYKVLLPTAKRMMPPKKSGLPPVDASRIEAIKTWIQNGAPEQTLQ